MVVLDSWALLAYLKDEPAAVRIEEEWLRGGAAMSSINLGETLYIRIRESGEESAVADIEAVRKRCTVVAPDWPLVLVSAQIKAVGGLSYADAFCIATALHLDAPLWTGDPEILEGAGQHSCEVVDLRAAKS